jgi:hypothetical protein
MPCPDALMCTFFGRNLLLWGRVRVPCLPLGTTRVGRNVIPTCLLAPGTTRVGRNDIPTLLSLFEKKRVLTPKLQLLLRRPAYAVPAVPVGREW